MASVNPRQINDLPKLPGGMIHGDAEVWLRQQGTIAVVISVNGIPDHFSVLVPSKALNLEGIVKMLKDLREEYRDVEDSGLHVRCTIGTGIMRDGSWFTASETLALWELGQAYIGVVNSIAEAKRMAAKPVGKKPNGNGKAAPKTAAKKTVTTPKKAPARKTAASKTQPAKRTSSTKGMPSTDWMEKKTTRTPSAKKPPIRVKRQPAKTQAARKSPAKRK